MTLWWTLFICLFLAPILLGILFTRIHYNPGKVGESYSAQQLRKLNKRKYFVINDLILRKRNGNTIQIDHVVVSATGIFVIETKNIYGNIHGSEKSKLWHSVGRNGRDLAFENPILQNESHIVALKEQIGDGSCARYISIVAFSPKADLQIYSDEANVIYWTELSEFIKSHSLQIMSTEEAYNIYQNILMLNVSDKNVREQHATNAINNKESFEQRWITAIENGKCPKCGGDLVLRKGKTNMFYGCSNYPNCTYTCPAI